MQKAKITNVRYEYGRAHGTLVEHPAIGTRGLEAGGPVVTSPITRQFKNGNFITLNTKYTVVKA